MRNYYNKKQIEELCSKSHFDIDYDYLIQQLDIGCRDLEQEGDIDQSTETYSHGYVHRVIKDVIDTEATYAAQEGMVGL